MFVLAHNLGGLSLLGPVAFGSVAKQHIMVGSLWQSKAPSPHDWDKTEEEEAAVLQSSLKAYSQ
jgi:succinate dehydrogenase/fumarate reductase flavoprotein subunit